MSGIGVNVIVGIVFVAFVVIAAWGLAGGMFKHRSDGDTKKAFAIVGVIGIFSLGWAMLMSITSFAYVGHTIIQSIIPNADASFLNNIVPSVPGLDGTVTGSTTGR